MMEWWAGVLVAAQVFLLPNHNNAHEWAKQRTLRRAFFVGAVLGRFVRDLGI
jgi:uncharacterized membrane protein YoaK (UPF0700 family)